MPAEEPWHHEEPLIPLISESLPKFLLPTSHHLPFDSSMYATYVLLSQPHKDFGRQFLKPPDGSMPALPVQNLAKSTLKV